IPRHRHRHRSGENSHGPARHARGRRGGRGVPELRSIRLCHRPVHLGLRRQNADPFLKERGVMADLAFKRRAFASRVRGARPVWAAGAYDALSPRCVEEAGFDAVFTTGFGISAAQLGAPDVGLYTMSENLTAVRGIAAAVSGPVVADGDT